MFQWISNDKPAPEALELETKLEQLETLEERYAEVQTDYITLQNGLSAFKQRYWKRVGALYAKLDAQRAEIARLRARLAPRDAMRQAAVAPAASQAQASADAARNVDEEVDCTPFDPTDELRRFYRMAARIVHPDRAHDEEDRKLRDDIMSRINVAYRDGRVHTIQALIDEYQMRAEPAEDDAATRLIRTIRLISRIREQIADISQSTANLRESGLYRLYKAVEEASARGEDRLRVIESGIERDIERADYEIRRLSQEIAERFTEPEEDTEPSSGVVAGPESEEGAQHGERGDGASSNDEAQTPRQSSQCEVEITVLLREFELPYQYRQPLEAGNAYVPAFTLRDSDGQPLLWEHQPVLIDDTAREQWQARLDWYAAQGFDAGVNLFITRDEPDGSLNLERLHRVAEFIRSLADGHSHG